MSRVHAVRHEAGVLPVPRLLAGLLLCGALLPAAAAPAHGATAKLDWADPLVVWPGGSLGPHVFPLTVDGAPSGVTATVSVTQPVSTQGIFAGGYPAEDCLGGCSLNNFGSFHDLGIRFDPAAGTPVVASPVIVEVVFSEPVTALRFEISDIDFSIAGNEAGMAQSHRRDQVTITGTDASNAGILPTLSYKTAPPNTFTISGNMATANCTGVEPACSPTDTTAAVPQPTDNPNPDSGSVVVDFGGQLVTKVTITYTEAGNGPNPASRGVAFLANLEIFAAPPGGPPVDVPALDTLGLALFAVLIGLAGAAFLFRQSPA
ncbi:MAG TPA: hypothetical protein VF789_10680 [Thermoanaerobaculia bacterium]